MKPNFSIHNLLLCVLIVLASVILYRSCNEKGPDNAGVVLSQQAYDNLNRRIDSLTSAATDRKEIIQASHDSTIYLTTEVIKTATYYKTITDTVLKLMACDSLAEQSILLARQARYNDSLHLVQERDLEAISSGKDTAITVLGSENKRLKKNIRKIVVAGSAVVVASAVIIYRKATRRP